jgi:hypothetical protein
MVASNKKSFDNAATPDGALGCEDGTLLNYEKFSKATNVASMGVAVNELIDQGLVTENNIPELCDLIDRWMDVQSLSYSEPKSTQTVLASRIECLQQIQSSLNWQNELSDFVNDELELRVTALERELESTGYKPYENEFVPQIR